MGQLFSSVMTRAFIYQIPYHKYHREVGKQKMKWKFNSISAMIFCKQSRGRVCFSVGISCSKRSILLIIHGSLFLSPWQSTSAFYVQKCTLGKVTLAWLLFLLLSLQRTGRNWKVSRKFVTLPMVTDWLTYWQWVK